MKRTITLRNDIVHYRGEQIEHIVTTIRNYFKLKSSEVYKYVITIVEGTQFSIDEDSDCYYIYKDSKYVGLVCVEPFDKLFFPLDENKKYDITVKKVRK